MVVLINILYFVSPPLVVMCNKQDGGLAKTAQSVQALLEKELEKVSDRKVCCIVP